MKNSHTSIHSIPPTTHPYIHTPTRGPPHPKMLYICDMAKKQKARKPQKDDITLKRCESEECFDLVQHAKKHVHDANDLIKGGHWCITPEKQIINGEFVANMAGIPGIGFIHAEKAGYIHKFGKPIRNIETIKGKEKAIVTLEMDCTEEDIDTYFASLRFVDPKHFVHL